MLNLNKKKKNTKKKSDIEQRFSRKQSEKVYGLCQFYFQGEILRKITLYCPLLQSGGNIDMLTTLFAPHAEVSLAKYFQNTRLFP